MALSKALRKLKRNWHFQRTMPRYAAAALRNPQWGSDALRTFGNGIHGRLPSERAPLYLLAACDDLYFHRYAIAFLRSVEAVGDAQAIHLHLIGPTKATLDEADRLARELRTVTLSITWDDAALAAWPVNPAFYYAAARFLIAHFLLTSTESPVLCLDIDGIVFRPIEPAYQRACADGDVAILLRLDNPRIWYRTLVCAVAVNPTEGGQRIASAAARMILACLETRPTEHVDQAAFYTLYSATKRMAPSVRWLPMPEELMDKRFSESSVIWSAKGSGKENERFVSALSRARGPISDRPL